MRYILSIVTTAALLPTLVHAADTFATIVKTKVIPIFDSIIGLAMVLAVAFFVLGVVRFMYTSGDDRSRESGKAMMVWGTLAVVVMVSVWGLVKIIKTTFLG